MIAIVSAPVIMIASIQLRLVAVTENLFRKNDMKVTFCY